MKSAWMICLFWALSGMALSQQSETTLPGRLFYTPSQRAMLNEARTHQVTDLPKMAASISAFTPSAPISFDGVITRSDGVATHWINGRPHVGSSSNNIRNLKPGQTRAAQKVYEPYQILQPETVRVPTFAPTLVKPVKREDATP